MNALLPKWHWVLRMGTPAKPLGTTSVHYPSRERGQRVADRHFRGQPQLHLEHDTTGELWLRDRGHWSCERTANDPTWLRAQGKAP